MSEIGQESQALAQDDPLTSAAPTDPPTPVAAPERYDSGKSPELLSWMIRTSGIFGFLIMLVAFIMVANIMTIGLQLRRENFLPPSFVEQFEQRLQAKDYQGAYDVAKESDSLIGRILSRGMSRVGTSVEEAEAGMQQVGEDESLAMEHKISYLALISSIAPMLGLLGTVTGMVYSLQAIATASPRPNELADGIATALFTTLEGLVVAVPAIVFYTLYRNRLARFLMECGFVATDMMKRFPKAR
jgi:biopolymer transport protein ExbB